MAWELHQEYPMGYSSSSVGCKRGEMKNSKIIVWALGAAVVAALLFLVMRPAGGVQNVGPAEFEQLVNEGVRVIDVRTPGEFGSARIPGAQNVPMNMLEAESAGWDRSQPVAVYCATGSRSVSAVEYLAAQGFTTIYHLSAGIVAWTGPVEQGQVAQVEPVEDQVSGTPVMYEFFTDW